VIISLEVRAIIPSPDHRITVAIDGGEDIVVTDRSKSKILPDVLAFSGIGANGNRNRLAFEAPRTIPIRRMDICAPPIDRPDTQTAAHIALLASVPFDILKSALKTDTPDGQIAFGTRDWKLFDTLDRRRAGMPVDVYIYESHQGGSFVGKATWRARYVGIETERHKAKPYRPKLAAETDTWEGEVYWIVERLRQMEPNEHIPVADFMAFGNMKPFGKPFPPHRPLLVEHPI